MTEVSEAEVEASAAAILFLEDHGIDPVEVARAALTAAAQVRAQAKRENCKHQRRQGSGTVSSSGVSHGFWHCPDCLASGEYHSPFGTMAIVGDLRTAPAKPALMPIYGATEDKEG